MHKKRSTREEREREREMRMGKWKSGREQVIRDVIHAIAIYVSQIDRLELFEGTTCEFIVLYSKE